jgi:uncharacterized membrane protein YdjX (TVP38/TMEM64 family)
MLDPNEIVDRQGPVALGLLRRQVTRHLPKRAAVGVWAVLLVGYFWYAYAYQVGVIDVLLALQRSPYGVLLYLVLYTLRPLLFFPASILSIAGGLFFGVVGGLVYSTIGSNLSALVAFVVGRYFGRGLLEANDSASRVQRYANRMRRNSFETVLIMRLLLLPYDLVNYFAGFLQINPRAFLVATLIGSFPATVSLVLIGVAGDLEGLTSGKLSLNPWALAGSVLFVALSLVISRLIRRREQRA